MKGYSAPKNPELMRVFRDLELVEHLGTGIRKILKKYDKSIYNFFPHFIIVSIKYNLNEFEYNNNNSNNNNNNNVSKRIEEVTYTDAQLSNVQKMLIKLIEDTPSITQNDMANMLGVTSRTVRNHIKFLLDNDYIRRIGADKKGKWEVINKING